MKSGKKALVAAINSKYIHSNPAVYSLAAYYKATRGEPDNAAWEVCVKEFSVNDAADNILQGIAAEKPDLLAFSVYVWNVETVKRLLSDVRAVLPDTMILLGGPEVSFGTEHCALDGALFDFVAEGEGELCFAELLDELALAQSTPSRVRRASRRLDMDELPFIYDEAFGFGGIAAFKNRIVYYETSRGCPFSCSYCLSGGDCSPVRFLAVEKVFGHIDFFAENKVPLVKFVDRTFNCNPARAKAIVEKICGLRKEDCATCFHFEVGADLFDDEFLELLSKVPEGRIQIEAGIQSFNEETLSASVRKVDNSRLFKNVEYIMKNGNINVHTDLIAGLPCEDAASFRDSFNKAYELGSHQLQLGFLKRLQGAPLCAKEEEYGIVFSKNAPYEVLSTKWLSYDDIMRLKRIEAALERYYNSGICTKTLSVLEKHFASPYDMYEAIAEFSGSNIPGGVYLPMSKRSAFDVLFDFAVSSGCEAEEIAAIMLTDYFSTDKSELPPDSLRFYWRHSRVLRQSEAEIFKENGIDDFKGFGIRIVGNDTLIFDYNKKNAVTGQYRLRKVIKGRL